MRTFSETGTQCEHHNIVSSHDSELWFHQLEHVECTMTLDHDILLTRLKKSHGVGETALARISSFIQGRQQSVTFNGHQSARIQLKYGVQQGSGLGPLLFIRYCTPQMSSPLPHHLVLEPTPMPTTANFISIALSLTNRLPLLDWPNALKDSRDGWSLIGWNWTPTRLNSCGLDPDSSWRRSTQRPWQSVNIVSNLRPPPRISAWHSTVNWEWTCM